MVSRHPGLERREFLRLGFGGILASGLQARGQAPVPVPRVNGGINIQPVRRLDPDAGLTPPLIQPAIVDAQMRALYELGYEHVRVTLSFDRFGPDFLAAIPYVRTARALGMDVLGVISQFTGFDLVQALADPATRDEVLETYARIFGEAVPAASAAIASAGRFAAQILNEPTHFLGISPADYVRDFLRLAFDHLKEDDPSILVVSAAAIGSAAGILQTREMIEAGLEHYCDRVAFHIYGAERISDYAGLSVKPVWITESGARGTSSHEPWMTTNFDRIRREVSATERIFWFDLFDLGTEGFRLIDLTSALDGSMGWVAESAGAVSWLRERVDEALAGAPAIPYRELVPDITLYFPAEEDFRILEATSFGLRR
jgi:hypothetical protein